MTLDNLTEATVELELNDTLYRVHEDGMITKTDSAAPKHVLVATGWMPIESASAARDGLITLPADVDKETFAEFMDFINKAKIVKVDYL